jgi:predicted Zn-dependent peptidase
MSLKNKKTIKKNKKTIKKNKYVKDTKKIKVKSSFPKNLNILKNKKFDVNYDMYSFENGMTLLSLPNKSFNSIYFIIYVRVGSKYEPLNLVGISHYLEHMLFKGTQKYKTHYDINSLLDKNGVDFNAFTDKNMTGYHYKFLSDENIMELVFTIAYQMLFKSLIRKSDSDSEKNVVIQEYKEMINNPSSYMDELIDTFAFKGHELGKSVIGDKSTISNITYKDMIEFYKKYYIPENMTISIGGNLPNNYLKILNKCFIKSKIKNKSNKMKDIFSDKNRIKLLPYIEIKDDIKNRILIKSKILEQCQLSIIFKTEGVYDINNDIYRLIANILGGNMSSRLFVKLRENLGLVYDVSCSLTNYEESGYFSIDTQLNCKDVHKCLENMLCEITKFIKNVSQKEVDENKKNYNDILISNLETLIKICNHYNNDFVFQKEIRSPYQKFVNINSVTLQNIKNISKQLFKKDKIKVICYGSGDVNKISNLINKYL